MVGGVEADIPNGERFSRVDPQLIVRKLSRLEFVLHLHFQRRSPVAAGSFFLTVLFCGFKVCPHSHRISASCNLMFSGKRGLDAMDDFGLLGASWGHTLSFHVVVATWCCVRHLTSSTSRCHWLSSCCRLFGPELVRRCLWQQVAPAHCKTQKQKGTSLTALLHSRPYNALRNRRNTKEVTSRLLIHTALRRAVSQNSLHIL